jgi:FlaA1/EpsC-like NDP-sugar epimerase
MEVEKIIDRPQYEYLLNNDNFKDLKDKFVLITGANGSIGTRLKERFRQMGVSFVATDIETLDITNENQVKCFFSLTMYDIIINIAGAKHAPKGEIEVESTLSINTLGVMNLLKYKGNAKLVLTSTCKSCNPETVYGATKLISERLTMNSGGGVARFYNVVESSGNVFEIWKDKDSIDVAANCNRYFISLDEAVGLTMYAALNKGRYSVNVDKIHNMIDVANRYTDKPKKLISPRKGDRVSELLKGTNEVHETINESLIKINNYFDAN